MNTGFFNISKLGLLSLRGFSILAKFLFTVLYFRYSEAAFGTYSLIATTVFLLVYLLGLDFYSYANRAVMEPGSHPQKIIFNQFSLYLILYVILFPVVYLIFRFENFNPHYLWLFYAVLVTEHLNLEFYRLLFVFKKPWAANINLFLRNGLWVLLAAGYIFKYQQIEIDTVLWLWLGGNLSALLFSLLISWAKRQKIDFQNFKIDAQWIKTGIIISLPYMFSTLSYKTIQFSDRYLIDWFMDKKAVGVYSFFDNMANVMNILIFTVVISVLYPGLVESIMKKDKNRFSQIYRQFKKEIIFYGLGIAMILSVVLPFILIYIGKDMYVKQFHVFLLLILGNFMLNLSFVHHYIIYAYKKDWKIFKATFIAAVLNIILNLILIPVLGISGAAIATFISFGTIYLFKSKDAQNLQAGF